MSADSSSAAQSPRAFHREMVSSSIAELTGRSVSDEEAAAVAAVLASIAEESSALARLDVGELEPALVYQFPR